MPICACNLHTFDVLVSRDKRFTQARGLFKETPLMDEMLISIPSFLFYHDGAGDNDLRAVDVAITSLDDL